MTAKMKPNAVLCWKGRKLMCGKVQVAVIAPYNGDWQYYGGYSHPDDWLTHTISGLRMSEKTARRAVNRRFGLPLDFGEKK